jgi:hypothetical protein
VSVKDGKRISQALVCPRCGCRSYFDITEYDFQYCTGFFGVGYCFRGDECLLMENLKRDNPGQLSKLRVCHHTKKALKNCKYFKPLKSDNHEND